MTDMVYKYEDIKLKIYDGCHNKNCSTKPTQFSAKIGSKNIFGGSNDTIIQGKLMWSLKHLECLDWFIVSYSRGIPGWLQKFEK